MSAMLWTKDHIVRSHANHQNLYEWLCETFSIEVYYDPDYGTHPFSYAIDGHRRMYQFTTDMDAVASAIREYVEADRR